MAKKLIVVAFGGNALIKDGRNDIQEQFKNLATPLRQIARLSKERRIVITHGNGPQVGNLMVQQYASNLPRLPLEILVAATQGQIGYMIEQTLDNEMMRIGVNDPLISTVLTYVLVDKNDPAFHNPTKPVGAAYKRKRKGFKLTDKGWRRVVASPKPLKIIEWREIKKLVDGGFIVIACGGGGIPVTSGRRRYEGVEAVIDKDLASAKLGEQIGADMLVIATEVPKVALCYKQPGQQLLDAMSVDEAQRYMEQGHFPEGSMGPKVQAAINFVLSAKGRNAIVTSIDAIEAAIKGKAGTAIYR